MLSKAPLRWILIVPFVAQITLAVGLTAWLSIRNGQKAVDNVADDLWAELTARTEQRIAEYTQVPRRVIADTIDSERLGLIDLQDRDTLTRHLWHQMQSHEGLFITAVGYETGEVIGVGVEPDGQLVIRAMEAGQTQLHTYAISEQGDRGQLIRADDFDLKNRPWYRQAVQAGELTWTGIYPNYSPPFNILSAASPIYDDDTGQLMGVTNATLSLWQLNNFLAALEVGQSGEIFITERTGELVASSTTEELNQIEETENGATRKRLSALESSQPRVQQATEQLIQQFGDLSQIRQAEQIEFAMAGEREIVQVTPLSDELGLDWLIVVAVPESDFMAQINANTRNTIWLCFGALILATGSSILTARWITHPLLRLNQTAKDITDGSLQSALPETAIATNQTREVSELTHSLNRMTQQLQASFAALQQSEATKQQVLDAIPDLLVWMRTDGTCVGVAASEQVKDLLPSGMAVGVNQYDVLPPNIAELRRQAIAEVTRTGRVQHYEQVVNFDNGGQQHEEVRVVPLEADLVLVIIRNISDRKRTEIQLQELTKRLELAARSAEMGIWDWDIESDRLVWDDLMFALYGVNPANFSESYTAWETVIHPDDFAATTRAVQQALAGAEDLDTEFRIIWPDGTVRYIEAHAIVLRDTAGDPTRMIGVNWDITDRKQSEIQLQDLTDRLGLAIQSADMGIWEWDIVADRLFWDEQMFTLYNLRPEEFDNVYEAWQSRVHPEDLAATQAMEQAALSGERDYEAEFRILWPDGTIRYLASYALVQRDAEGQPTRMVGANLDISDRKQAEEQLVYSALHDALTDLPNRTLLTSRLELAIQRAQRSPDYHFAVLLLDLDQFKVINDSLGHLVGDQLLLTVAHKLRGTIRPTDLAARLGGDEFVILIEHIPNIQAVIHTAERLLEEFDRPTVIDGHRVFVTTSIGIVWGTSAYTAASDLLRDGDIALYRAKDRGRGRYEIFDVEMHVQAVKRMRLENDLRLAIDRQEFLPYYQPVIDLHAQRLIGFEALIRWQHPTRGFVSPADFIPVAEETGLISSISQWILRSACEQIAAWQRQFPDLTDLRVSVNLSGQDLRQPTLVETVRHTLSQAQLSANSLTLEITESLLIEDIETTIERLGQLRDLGVRISIDDFGTGYSSLSYLYNLPADYLKIDQSFVGNMQLGDKNYKIVQAVVSLSDQLQLAAIAEGIETAQQLEWLKSLGCELGQGYLLSRPLAAHDATAFIATGCSIPL